LGASVGRSFSRVSIGGEIAGDGVFRGAGLMTEVDRHAVIGKGVGSGIGFVGERSREGEGDLVPLPELAGDGDGAVAVGGGFPA